MKRFALEQLADSGLEVSANCARKALDEEYSLVVEADIVNVAGKPLRLDVYVGLDSVRHNELIRECTAGIGALSTSTRINSGALWFPCFSYGVYSGYFWSGDEVGIRLDGDDGVAKEVIARHMQLTLAEAVPAMCGFANHKRLYGFVRNFVRPVAPWEMACAICAYLAGRPDDAVAMYTMNAQILAGPDREAHAIFWSRLSGAMGV